MSKWFGGRWFGGRWWGPRWFGEETDDIPPAPPATVGTFILLLNAKANLQLSWATDLFKSYSGLERRANLVDDPRFRISGSAYLAGNDTSSVRAQLASYMALGLPFSLALPFEEAIVTADSSGSNVFCDTTTRDWAVPGMRVAIIEHDNSATEGVVQQVFATYLKLDITIPSGVGLKGTRIMPSVPIYLDPQQSFARYPAVGEEWQISGTFAMPGYTGTALKAELAAGSVSSDTALDNVVFRALEPGAAGNEIGVSLQYVSPPVEGVPGVDYDYVEVSEAGVDIEITFTSGANVGHLRAAIAAHSELVEVVGGTNGDPLNNPLAEFSISALTGGADETSGDFGKGATLTTLSGSPVWDVPLDNDSTSEDLIHAMTESVDFGGRVFNFGTADRPDWGRRIAGTFDLDDGWQWLKKFLGTVAGRWRSFWLATWRSDLTYVSGAGTTSLVVERDPNFGVWFPRLNRRIQIQAADGSLVHAYINGATTSSTTHTLTLATAAPATVVQISWLERCRMETDDVTISFDGHLASIQVDGRVVRQPDEQVTPIDTWLEIEASVEQSRPREGIEIMVNGTVGAQYRIATGTRDFLIGAAKFSAFPAIRGEIKVLEVGENGDFDIMLPVSHPVVQRYMKNSTPPGAIDVAIWRYQPGVDEGRVRQRGRVQTVSIAGLVATVRCAQALASALTGSIPTVGVSRQCHHVLYDANCRAARSGANVVATTVTNIDGRTVTVASIGGKPNGWAEGDGGALDHVASGESMAVVSQVGTTIELLLPIVELKVGDAVNVVAGCNHDDDCHNVFANEKNYGGFAFLPTKDPQVQTGFGIVEST